MRWLVGLFLVMVLVVPTATACETEAARLLSGKFPSPTGISPDKDESIREASRLAAIGQETARHMLWRVLMGETLTEREVADEIDRAMIENGSNPDWPSFDTIVAAGSTFKSTFGIAVSKSRILYILVTYIVKALPCDCTLTDSKTLHCTIK